MYYFNFLTAHCGNKFQWLKKIKGNAPAKYVQAKALHKHCTKIFSKDMKRFKVYFTFPDQKESFIFHVSSLINGYIRLLFSKGNSILPANFRLTN